MILMQQGEIDIIYRNDKIEDIRDKTPTGSTTKEKMVLSLYGTYAYPLKWATLEFWAQLDWAGRRILTKSNQSYSHHESDLQFTLGVGITF